MGWKLVLFFLFSTVLSCKNQASQEMKDTLKKSLHEFIDNLETTMREGSCQLENLIGGDASSERTKQCSRGIQRRDVCGTTVAPNKSAKKRAPWNGPSNSCARLLNSSGSAEYVVIDNYPENVAVDYDLPNEKGFDDHTSRIEVRDGCMVTLWLHPAFHFEARDLRNVEYGTYEVNSIDTGTAEQGWWGNGLTRVDCKCDPLKTEQLEKKKTEKDCVIHHLWNEKTERCESILPDGICGEIYFDDLQSFPERLRIPNWPLNKRYDGIGNEAVGSITKVTSITVRNGCFATMYSGEKMNSAKTLETKGYGVHTVAKGTQRIVCECMNDDSENDEFVISNPETPACLNHHAFNKNTGLCEWIGRNDSAIELTNKESKKCALLIDDFPKKMGSEKDLQLADCGNYNYSKQTTKAIVRRGCMATFWTSTGIESANDYENKMLANVEYGEYEIQDSSTGTAGASKTGLTRVSYTCDPTQVIDQRAPKEVPCQPNHVYDDNTGHCEWQLEENICGEIENSDGEKMFLRIPNWPLNKRYDVNLRHAKLDSLHNKIHSITIRQHCFATLYNGPHLTSRQILTTRGYGNYPGYITNSDNATIPTQRIVCECMYS